MLESTTPEASRRRRVHAAAEAADALTRRLARRLGEDVEIVARNLILEPEGPAWSTRFAAAAGTRPGVFAGEPRWRPGADGRRVEVKVAPRGDARIVGRALTVDEATARGWLVPGTAPDETIAVLRRRALALLVEIWVPEALALLPVSNAPEGWAATRARTETSAPDRSWVIYDDRGFATPRRPTSPENYLARVEILLARAETPLRLLDLNATTLLAAASLLDDGTERVARLWRIATARPPEAG